MRHIQNKKLLVESAIPMIMIPQEECQSLNDKLDPLAEMIENRNATDHNTYIRSHRIGEVK